MFRSLLAALCAVLIASFILLFVSVPGWTKPLHSNVYAPECSTSYMPCEGAPKSYEVTPSRKASRYAKAEFGSPIVPPETQRSFLKRKPQTLNTFGNLQVSTQGIAQILPHPSGCPSRAFCGCGAAVRIFGSPVRSLWLAANWFGFPRAAPAPEMAAVRRHHVFILESHVGGDEWIVTDANSGGHATRRHVRSIAGYVIVNPRGGSKWASAS